MKPIRSPSNMASRQAMGVKPADQKVVTTNEEV